MGKFALGQRVEVIKSRPQSIAYHMGVREHTVGHIVREYGCGECLPQEDFSILEVVNDLEFAVRTCFADADLQPILFS